MTDRNSSEIHFLLKYIIPVYNILTVSNTARLEISIVQVVPVNIIDKPLHRDKEAQA